MDNQNEREHWGSKVGFILAAAGSAVGLGNIWKFPYITGENGGAAFVIVYLICILMLGLPIMIAELVIGRHTEKDPVGAFKIISKGSKWTLVGYLGVLSGFFILSFYSVVGGWTFAYIIKSVTGIVSGMTELDTAKRVFSEFSASTYEVLLYHLIFLASCMFIVIKGIKNGIEKWSKFLMPLIFLILVILIIKGISMEGGIKGVIFLLKPDFSKLNIDSIISALGHSFFTLSLGMGAMITYGSYLSKRDKILHSAFYIVLIDTAIALLAGLAIFPAVFAVGIAPDKGPGLIFHIIPVVFASVEYGIIFAAMFFILLFVAALTSGISLFEVVVAYVIDEKGWSRKKAVYIFGAVIFLLGVPSALSFGVMKDITIFLGNNFFDFMDKLTANYMLPVGGLLIALCLGWKYGLENTMHELDPDTKIISVKELWAFSIKFLAPILLLIVFLAKLRDLFV